MYGFVVLAALVAGLADAYTYARVDPAAPVIEMSPLARAVGYGLLAGVLCKSLMVGAVCLFHFIRYRLGEPVVYEIGLIWFYAVVFAYGAWTNVSLGWR